MNDCCCIPGEAVEETATVGYLGVVPITFGDRSGIVLRADVRGDLPVYAPFWETLSARDERGH